jgi:hypothetical protein
MNTNRDPIESTNTPDLTRRRMLGTLGAAMGALTVTRDTQAASAASTPANTPCSIRVAAVSYVPPFHDHRKAGVNLQPLREMTGKVAKERPDFVCYPEICACAVAGFSKGIEVAPELETLRDFLTRSVRLRNERLTPPSAKSDGATP